MSNNQPNIKADNSPIEISDPFRLSEHPLISVLMLAYNHDQYLSDAIEGVLMQQTDFTFELIIAEDCSSDNTRAIAKAYQKEHPDLIRIITSTSNVGMNSNFLRAFQACRGQYIAFCEGDDYWINKDKLRAQVAVFDDSRIVVVHSDHAYNQQFLGSDYEYDLDGRFASIDKLSLSGSRMRGYLSNPFIATCTVMYRHATLLEFVEWANRSNIIDYYDSVIALYALSRGDVQFVDMVSSVYRKTPGSATRSGAQGSLRIALGIRETAEQLALTIPEVRALHGSYWTSSSIHIVKCCVYANVFHDFDRYFNDVWNNAGRAYRLYLLALKMAISYRADAYIRIIFNLKAIMQRIVRMVSFGTMILFHYAHQRRNNTNVNSVRVRHLIERGS